MTDKEIIKALKCLSDLSLSNNCELEKCRYYRHGAIGCCQDSLISENALDLIKRQSTKIDELNKVNALAKYQNEKICKLEDELRRAKSEISKFYDQADDYCNEAIDVFADSLKIKLNRTINNLVKEMTEVEE